jgi:hypothetical protein
MVVAVASQALVVIQEVAVSVNTVEPKLFALGMAGKYEVQREMVSVHMGKAVWVHDASREMVVVLVVDFAEHAVVVSHSVFVFISTVEPEPEEKCDVDRETVSVHRGALVLVHDDSGSDVLVDWVE